MRQGTYTSLKGAVLFLLGITVSGRVSIAQVDPWERVRLLEEGKNVSITLHSGSHVDGKILAWSLDGVRIQRGRSFIPVAKTDIARVELVTGMSRARKAAWAGGITGGIIGGLVGLACAEVHCKPSGVAVASQSAAIYGGGAAGIAALFPAHKELFYSAPPPPGSWRRTHLLYSADASVKSGDNFPIKIQIGGDGGRDLSSPLLPLRAVGISSAVDAAAPVTPLSRTANRDDLFRYDPRLGGSGGYRFDQNTTGLEPGTYSLHYQVGSDPQTHTMPFHVK